jgi:hypothetical protein
MATTGLHAHGCTRCRARYEDACTAVDSNGLCSKCAGRHGWPLLIASRQPRDCCHAYGRPTSKDDRKTYRLSAACDWFICPVCARTFPYRNPKESS